MKDLTLKRRGMVLKCFGYDQMDETLMEQLTDAHEVYDPDDTPRPMEKTMDLHNNQIGRNIGNSCNFMRMLEEQFSEEALAFFHEALEAYKNEGEVDWEERMFEMFEDSDTDCVHDGLKAVYPQNLQYTLYHELLCNFYDGTGNWLFFKVGATSNNNWSETSGSWLNPANDGMFPDTYTITVSNNIDLNSLFISERFVALICAMNSTGTLSPQWFHDIFNTTTFSTITYQQQLADFIYESRDWDSETPIFVSAMQNEFGTNWKEKVSDIVSWRGLKNTQEFHNWYVNSGYTIGLDSGGNATYPTMSTTISNMVAFGNSNCN